MDRYRNYIEVTITIEYRGTKTIDMQKPFQVIHYVEDDEANIKLYHNIMDNLIEDRVIHTLLHLRMYLLTGIVWKSLAPGEKEEVKYIIYLILSTMDKVRGTPDRDKSWVCQEVPKEFLYHFFVRNAAITSHELATKYSSIPTKQYTWLKPKP